MSSLARRLLAARMRERNAAEPKAVCGCGCGGLMARWRMDGTERRFLNGHHPGQCIARSKAYWRPPVLNVRAPAFRAQGACAGHKDPELFFDLSRAEEARKVCADCPVAWECLAWGLKHEREGIWGGKTPQQRAVLRSQIRQVSRAREGVPTVTER